MQRQNSSGVCYSLELSCRFLVMSYLNWLMTVATVYLLCVKIYSVSLTHEFITGFEAKYEGHINYLLYHNLAFLYKR